MTNDGSHTYTYDAEGNITKVDSGTTAAYLYDALNHRVRTTVGTAQTEFVFNQNGQWREGVRQLHHFQHPAVDCYCPRVRHSDGGRQHCHRQVGWRREYSG